MAATRFLLWLVGGVRVAPCALVLAFISASVGHGHYVAATQPIGQGDDGLTTLLVMAVRWDVIGRDGFPSRAEDFRASGGYSAALSDADRCA